MTPVQVPAPPPFLLLDRTRHRGIAHRPPPPPRHKKVEQKIRPYEDATNRTSGLTCRPPSIHAGETSHLLYKMQGKQNTSSLSPHRLGPASSTICQSIARSPRITAVRKSGKPPRGFTMKNSQASSRPVESRPAHLGDREWYSASGLRTLAYAAVPLSSRYEYQKEQ